MLHDLPPERKRRLAFQIEHEDYFATLATRLDLLRQRLPPAAPKDCARALNAARDELLFLAQEYRIVPRTEAPGKER